MKTLSLALAGLAVAATPVAAQTRSGAWGSQYNMGTYAVGTDSERDRSGWISLQCNADKNWAGLYTEIKGQAPPGGATVSIKVNDRSGSRNYAFRTNASGVAEMPARSARFVALWNDLRRSDTAVVRYPDGRFWVASLAGAGKVLTAGGCAD